jgi:DNA-binding MarR family transcriptional regulator
MAEGLVEKGVCASDARVSYAVLTDDGFGRCHAALGVHSEVLDRLVGARVSEEELDQLTELLERIAGGVEGEPCRPGSPAGQD